MKNLIKNMLLLWLCAIVSHTAIAQGTIVWKKPLTRLPDKQELKSIVQSRDKQAWVGVSNSDFRMNFQRVRSSAIAFDAATGDTLWYRTFFDEYTEAIGWGVANAPNGHFWVVIKYIWAYNGPYESTGIAVFELDSLGNVLQQKEFMQNCNSFNTFAVYSQPDGGLIIVGAIARKPPGCTEWDIFALRLDGEGNQLWQGIYSLPHDQGILSAGLYPDNKLCIGYFDANTSYQNRMLFIDVSSGILLYKKNTPSGAGHYNLSCQPLRDGSFIVGGVASSNTTINNAYIARADANFNILWERIDYTSVIYGDDIIETTDSCVILRGTSQPNARQFMAKVDLKTGQELWRTYFTYPDSNSLRIVGATIGHDDDFYVFGNVVELNTTSGQDFYVARYTGVADFLQPSDYCSDSLRANFAGTWQQDTLRLHSISNSGMAHQDSVDCQWLIGGNTVSLDTAFQQTISMQANPEGVNVTLVITNFWGCKDTLIARVLPNGTITGNRPDIRGGSYLKNAYPNPSMQNVSIGYTLPAKTENAVLRVYEMSTGRTVAERNLSALDSEVKFNVSGWATGVYAYQLYVNGAPVAVKKMTVSR